MTETMTQQTQQMMQTKASNLKDLVTATLSDAKAIDISCLDLNNQSSLLDYMIVCSATSNRHAKSIANKVTNACKDWGQKPMGIEGADSCEWILIDLNDMCVHIMLPQARDFYQLERLWSVPDDIDETA